MRNCLPSKLAHTNTEPGRTGESQVQPGRWGDTSWIDLAYVFVSKPSEHGRFGQKLVYVKTEMVTLGS